MINPSDSIKFRNVISKRYRFYYKDMEEVMEQFLNDIDRKKATVKGPLFYSLNNVPMDKIMNVEFFMPIEEEKIEIDEDMFFQSYFSIENMVSISMYDNFETNTEIAYRVLLDYIDDNKLKQVTPIFHVISGDRTMQYVFIKMGVTQEKKEEQSEYKLFKGRKDSEYNEVKRSTNSNFTAFK